MNERDVDFFVELETEIYFDFECNIVLIEGDRYTGEYDVIPNFRLQKLETENKVMEDDVRVHQIPVEKTTNQSGGYTIVIGGPN